MSGLENWGNGGLECWNVGRVELLIVNEKKDEADDG
jgi:hypothetical protein